MSNNITNSNQTTPAQSGFDRSVDKFTKTLENLFDSAASGIANAANNYGRLYSDPNYREEASEAVSLKIKNLPQEVINLGQVYQKNPVLPSVYLTSHILGSIVDTSKDIANLSDEYQSSIDNNTSPEFFGYYAAMAIPRIIENVSPPVRALKTIKSASVTKKQANISINKSIDELDKVRSDVKNAEEKLLSLGYEKYRTQIMTHDNGASTSSDMLGNLNKSLRGLENEIDNSSSFNFDQNRPKAQVKQARVDLLDKSDQIKQLRNDEIKPAISIFTSASSEIERLNDLKLKQNILPLDSAEIVRIKQAKTKEIDGKIKAKLIAIEEAVYDVNLATGEIKKIEIKIKNNVLSAKQPPSNNLTAIEKDVLFNKLHKNSDNVEIYFDDISYVKEGLVKNGYDVDGLKINQALEQIDKVKASLYEVMEKSISKGSSEQILSKNLDNKVKQVFEEVDYSVPIILTSSRNIMDFDKIINNPRTGQFTKVNIEKQKQSALDSLDLAINDVVFYMNDLNKFISK